MVMKSLFDLYPSILVPLFSEWINEWDLCNLDCAMTQSRLRDSFLSILTRCSVENRTIRNECYFSKLEWIALRRICLRTINLNYDKLLNIESLLINQESIGTVICKLGPELIRFTELCPVIHSLETADPDSLCEMDDWSLNLPDLWKIRILSRNVIPILKALRCSHLKHLSVYHSIDIAYITYNFPHLISVELRYDGPEDAAPTHVENLQHITLNCYSESIVEPPKIEWNNPGLLTCVLAYLMVTDDYLIDLVHHCPALTCLEVSGSITDKGLMEVAQCCPAIRKLKIGTEITDKGLLFLVSKCCGLNYLDIDHCQHVTDVGVKAVLKGCQLTFLGITNCSYALIRGGLTCAFKLCPSLTKVAASDIRDLIHDVHSAKYVHIDPRTVQYSQSWYSTHSVTLSTDTGMPASEFLHIFLMCNRLLELVIGSPSFDVSNADKILKLAVNACPLLTALSCTPVGKASLRAITAGGGKLKKLCLRADDLTDFWLTPLVRSQPDLRKLSLKRISKKYAYTDAFLNTLAQSCPGLSSVVFECDSITDKGVSHLLRECKQLRSLDLENCTSVAKGVLDTLVELNRSITMLNVVNCKISHKESVTFLEQKTFKIVFYSHQG